MKELADRFLFGETIWRWVQLSTRSWLRNSETSPSSRFKYRLLETKSNDPAKEMMENIKDRKAFDANTAPIKVMAGKNIKTAISYIRTHAKELNINPEKLGVSGFQQVQV